jgi:hypothetical protein
MLCYGIVKKVYLEILMDVHFWTPPPFPNRRNYFRNAVCVCTCINVRLRNHLNGWTFYSCSVFESLSAIDAWTMNMYIPVSPKYNFDFLRNVPYNRIYLSLVELNEYKRGMATHPVYWEEGEDTQIVIYMVPNPVLLIFSPPFLLQPSTFLPYFSEVV